jgi:CheY-like chemotaxis protein
MQKSAIDPQLGKRHPLNILLVDDTEMNQELALAILEQLGFCADVANNGCEAVLAVKRRSYDVVLMDVQMPEMDGLEATRVIRRELETALQPEIFAMTAADMQEDRELCLAAGMNGFLGKPIQVKELIDVLSRCRPVSQRDSSSPPDQAAERLASDKSAGGAARVLDMAVLERLNNTLGKKAMEMIPGLIDGFLEKAPGMLERLRRFLENGDSSDLRREAHTLKSNSGYFGAMALVEAARELEKAAKSKELEGAGMMLERVATEFARAREALEKVRKEMH